MMTWSRRRFLSTALLAGSSAPVFWRQVAQAAPADATAKDAETILVVVQLSGGNDGLNTVIPFTDPAYTANRPTLKQPAGSVLKINSELAFHPSLKGLSKLLEDSRLSILQGVGYPDHNRSHFESMDIWHRGTVNPRETFGWLGRATELLDPTYTSIHVAGGDLPLALRSPASRAVTVRSLAEFQLKLSQQGKDDRRKQVVEKFVAVKQDEQDLLAFVKRTARETYSTSAKLQDLSPNYKTPVSYPSTGLGSQLKLIAQLISAGIRQRVYYAELGGFDTHSDQADPHSRLLSELGDALLAFQSDMVHHGQQSRVLTLTFSEFGRRVKENGSQGTDHGAGSQMFLVGENITAGPIGKHPSLEDLDSGDLKFHTDFRHVYATLLDDWLHLPSEKILYQQFPKVSLWKAKPTA